MALQDKYAELLQTATTMGVGNLASAEKDGVLHVSGTANSTSDYDALWALYDKLDPGMASGDLMMNIDIKADAGAQLKVRPDTGGVTAVLLLGHWQPSVLNVPPTVEFQL